MAGRCVNVKLFRWLDKQRKTPILPKECRTAGARNHVCITADTATVSCKERLVCVSWPLEKEVSEAKKL